MMRLGARLGPLLRRADVVRLHGDLGAGKTTLARGLIRAMAPETEDVPSPTFSLVQIYDQPTPPLWHFDLYRLGRDDEIWELGFEDALEEAVSLVEWPQKAERMMPPAALCLNISTHANGARQVTFETEPAYSDLWREQLAPLSDWLKSSEV